MAQLLTLVNRTSKTLKGVWDGRHYDLPPGKQSFPDTLARKFKEQNPRMGTENPYNLQCEYLIGIEEDNDDCTPIEQTVELERWRTKAQRDEDPGTAFVTKKVGLYAEERQAPLNRTGSPVDSSFVDPTV